MKTPLWQRLLWVGLIVVLLGVVGRFALERMERSGTWRPASPETSATDAPLPVLWRAPEFELTDQAGRAARRADLSGRLWLADFIFTRCGGQCPALTVEMRKLQDEIPDALLVSFSVDPEHDTPEVLSAYAQKFGAHPERWRFLTGPREALWTISEKGFKLSVMENAKDEREPIAHDPRIQLVDRLGRVRGQYSVNDPEAMRRLREDAARLRLER
jgi:cytochrome oxidase Cu insertion factor (SCO1/SenC/PrrC family)